MSCLYITSRIGDSCKGIGFGVVEIAITAYFHVGMRRLESIRKNSQRITAVAGPSEILKHSGKHGALMKRWAVLTVLLYALALLVLTAPALLIAFGAWAKDPGLHPVLQVYSEAGYWILLVILVGGQALFLLLPIHVSERRLPARRPVRILIFVTGFFLANLLFAGLLSIVMAGFKEDGLFLFRYFSPTSYSTRLSWGQEEPFLGMLISLPVFWILWALVFRSFAKSDDPNGLVKRATRWLLRGSILELLIAVPSHIIVRRRGDCCAPILTFWGIATGISVMLLCFGPGVFFLFAERFKRLQSKSAKAVRTG